LAGREQGTRELDPRERVVERGEPLVWLPPADVDSLVVALNAAEQPVVIASAAGGDTLSERLAPGSYTYIARAYKSGEVVEVAEGPTEVEAFSRELLPREASATATTEDFPSPPRENGGGSGRPLASLGWPYLLLIALFCGEWAVRRLGGLR
jgi:hypothetical protein